MGVSTNSTNDAYPLNKDVSNSDGIYTNEDINYSKVTPIVNVDDVIIKDGENIIIPFNVTDNEGKLIPGGAIVSLNWLNNTVSQYVELENGKGLANFSVDLLIGKVSDSNNTINLPDLIGDILKLLNLNTTSEIITNPINISETAGFDIFNLFNITIHDIDQLNVTIPDYSDVFNNLNLTLPNITELINDINITDILNGLNITLPDYSDVFNNLNLTLPDITELINDINITDILNGLNITLPDLVGLIDDVNISDVLDGLNITLPDLVGLIDDVNISDVLDGLNITLPDIVGFD